VLKGGLIIMKRILGRLAAVTGTLLMGASIVAAAVPYTDGSANVAIVYGSDGAAETDLNTAMQLNTQAAAAIASVATGDVTVTGGDSYQFEKSSTKFHLGDNFTTIRTTVNDEQLTTLLADGEYTDDDNDEFDYTQKITMGEGDLTLFESSEYEDDVPTVGIHFNNDEFVLNYTLTFSDNPEFADLATTDLPLMGKEYYVLNNGTSYSTPVLTLLDSAADTVLTEGESTTLNVEGTSYDVSISFISETEVKLNVNGETTNSLSESETYKLDDGSYVGIKDILYSSKDSGVSKVEFSIGSGKLVLTDGAEVELNEETITGLTATIENSSSKLSSIVLTWSADDDLFVTEDSVVTMPGFEAVSLSYAGMDYPAEEEIKIDVSNEVFTLTDFPLEDGEADIDLYYINESSGNFSGYGKDSDDQLLISSGTSITFNASKYQYFIASWNDTTDSASYLMRATSFITESDVNKTTIQYMKDGTWTDAKTKAQNGDEVTIGDLTLNVGVVNRTEKTVVLSQTDGSVQFDTLYTAEGLAITLALEPTTTTTFANHNVSSMTLTFAEEDKSDNLAAGGTFSVVLGSGGSTTYTASVTSVTGLSGSSLEIENSDVYRQFEYSALATETLYDKGDSDAKSLTVIYHGDEVAADVFITSADATVSTSSEVGSMAIMDSEASSYASANWVVVGGNCVNSVAADLLGTSDSGSCLDAFEEATGAGAGEFLIQEVTRSNGKMALIVAGYNAVDTVRAGEMVLNEDYDEGVFTTATSAVVTEA
jgi:hypothetical protein